MNAPVIHVVLAVYDPSGNYSRHAGVLLTSLFSRASGDVLATVLHDSTLSGDNRERFVRTAKNQGHAVRFIDVSERILKIAPDPDKTAGGFSRGTLYRLMIPELLDIPKVIYLDCDILVNLDIRELWEVPIGDASLAATRDLGVISKKKRLRGRLRSWAMGYDASRYFNAGVLVMNLERIRAKCNLPKEALRFFERYPHCADLVDQDFLNSRFRDDVVFIDDRFQSRECHNVDNAILHLTGGGCKPWTLHRSTPRDYLYWETFARSEWKDRLVRDMLEVYKNNPLTHFRTSDCLRRIGTRWKRDLFTSNTLTRLAGNVGLLAEELRRRAAERRS